ncbi:MAG: pseudouridine synthase, partial [Clostridiaceae bacterium]
MNREDKVRLNKFISDKGICSRREADKLIEDRKVFVNGISAVTGMKVSLEDNISVNGEILSSVKKKVYIALNKPVGVVSTTEHKITDNIIDFINYKERIFPIGRLDKPSEGLILLTNDGDIVNKILRAGNNHEKEYLVWTDK